MKKNTHDADVAFIRALAELLRETDLTEIEVEREYGADDGLSVRVWRQSVQQVVAPVSAAPAAAVAPSPIAAPAAAELAAATDPAEDPGAVTSPMV